MPEQKMTAMAAHKLADGGKIRARMPDEGATFHAASTTVESDDAGTLFVKFDAGWGTCTLNADDVITVETE